MKLISQSPKKALKAFLKQKPLRSEIDIFKANLIGLLDKISTIEKRPTDESEEHLKNDLRDFLRDTYYKDINAINTKDKKDLVIHLGKSTDSEVGVIIEAKRPNNLNEMISAENPNKKALHELILYYLDERNKVGNIQLKQLVITNINEWYLIDANQFDKHIYRNTQIRKLYETKINDRKDNPFFYEEIAKIIQRIDVEIPCIYFDIRKYETILRNNKKEDDRELSSLFKILSPLHLMKIATPNDSNSLDERFYKELLHIIGLEETREGSKNIIRRKKEKRNAASFIETIIEALNTEEVLHRLPDQSAYGTTREERIFNVSLELCITWINRILFLKLLEGQLVTYHQGNKSFCFLNTETIHDFDELFKLFHKVLAVNLNDRTDAIKSKYGRVPYLNSSLFEISELEDQTIKINALDDAGLLELIGTTILKDQKKKVEKLPTLDYLFRFLDAYDFASEGTDEVQEDNKTLINASVLGKVFEKINGYKDGSIFTPGFITMFMCRQSIRLAVVQKFKEKYGWNIETFDDIKNYIADRKSAKDILEFNAVIDSLRICDPAVGSGHFLVSSLNEIIAIKSDLGIFADDKGLIIDDFRAEIIDDELRLINKYTEDDFEYRLPIITGGKIIKYRFGGDSFRTDERILPSQRIQKTLFHEKQTIIENCLFGVDINANSVKICRLRLWIELLKNAYYKEETDFTELETLPNIDINIKCGNSLINQYALDADLKKVLQKSNWTIASYRQAVSTYRSTKSKDLKREMEALILQIKQSLTYEFRHNDPLKTRLDKLSHELYNRFTGNFLFEPQSDYGKNQKELDKKALIERQKLDTEINSLTKKIDEIKHNKIYKNAFEWRFEFPEVLNDKGDFEGFDVVIGNPPYISLSKMKEQAEYFQNAGYQTYSKGSDIYCLFYERGNQILKSKGLLTFITSNSWLRAIYGDLLKKYFTQNMQPISLLNIEDIQVFDEATVESNIITLQKHKDETPFFVSNLSGNYILGSSLSAYFKENSFEYIIPETSEWSIGNEESGNLKAKIERNSKLLKEFDVRINFGIKTGYNAAFIIDEATKNSLVNEDPTCLEIIKPILRGRDLKKYSYEFSNQWSICTFPSLKIDIESYPSVLNHFLNFGKSRLEQSGEKESRKKTNNKWFETQDSISYWKDFEKPKIIWGEIADKPKFAYDDCNYYAEATTFLMTGEKLKFLLAILNSNVSEWYFNKIGTTTGMGTNRWKKYKIELLPIKIPSEDMELKIETLVDKIRAQKQQGIDSTENERKIDELVYKLYELTPDEISIIENS
ncbi:MAG: TaqI-like C-terminal specificity domain-containing protein [Bacteroidota bacterium]|nr:TaqI-like C-terminal specificity domain-containing protein [Bacteroidota bacterium]